MEEIQLDANIDRINEEENALDSLEMVTEFINRVDMKHPWKWISIALFNTLYGFCIVALRGYTFDNVVKPIKCKRCETPFPSAFDVYVKKVNCPNCGNDLSKEKVRLIDFNEAFKRVQKDGQIEGHATSKGIKFTHNQITSVKKLQESYRNNFEHPLPVGFWFTHKNNEIVLNVMEVIEKIVTGSGHNSIVIEDDTRQRFQAAIEKIKSAGKPK